MNELLNNEFDQALDKLMENDTKFSKKQTDMIKSLPEKERLKIFKAMQEDREQNGFYASWKELVSDWRVISSIIIIITLLTLVLFNGWSGAWEIFKEIIF